MQTSPEADVIWWNAKSFYIQCPFCDEIHRHTVNWKLKNHIRASHCGKGGSYRCCFPMNEQGEVAYEIEKKRGRYTNICVHHDSEDLDDVDRLVIEFTQKVTVAEHSITSLSPVQPGKREIDRQENLHHLGCEVRKSKIVFGRSLRSLQTDSYYFKASPARDSLVLYGPIAEYPISTSYKTVAHLVRGGSFPSIGAMSGWSHSSVHALRVNGRQWTDDVFYISEVVGHVLPSDSKDQGKVGQYNACHAEKQLIAYFIDRHVFLPRDRLPDSHLERIIEAQEHELEEAQLSTEIGQRLTSLRKRKSDLEYELFDGDEKLVGKSREIRNLELKLKSVEATVDWLIASPEAKSFLKLESRIEVLKQRRNRHTDLTDMATAPPPSSLTEAVILTSSPLCQDCIMFKNKVNNFFGLSLELNAAF